MRLKLVSDGSTFPQGSRVETSDGEPIEGVKSAIWHKDAAGRPYVTLQLSICDVEINYSHEGDPINRP